MQLRHHDRRPLNQGFTLIELMVVVAIVAILTAIAYPSYMQSVTKARRRTAELCLINYANYMERIYSVNLRYDQDSNGNPTVLPTLDCVDQGSQSPYAFSFATPPTSDTYTVQAVPQGNQAQADSACGTLSLNQTMAKEASGPSGASCWQ